MVVHLMKLCVGVESVGELSRYREAMARRQKRSGRAIEGRHVTRNHPKRAAEVLAGGSLYWVIRGRILVRHPILRLEEVEDDEGRAACAIIYDPILILTQPQPRRAFQGWRYLEAFDAPPDLADQKAGLAALGEAESLPADLRSTLQELGLL